MFPQPIRRRYQGLCLAVLASLVVSLWSPSAGQASPAAQPPAPPASDIREQAEAIAAQQGLDSHMVAAMLESGMPPEDIDPQLAVEWPAHLQRLAERAGRRQARPDAPGLLTPEIQRPAAPAVPSQDDATQRLWLEIEAARSAGNPQRMAELALQLPPSEWTAAARLLHEILPTTVHPLLPPSAPVSADEEARQAQESAAQRASLQQAEAASRTAALAPDLEAEKLATPAGAENTAGGEAILTVGDSCTYATLQAAINVASSGDTIRVQGRTYAGAAATANINAKSLSIYGGYNSTCTVQGSSPTVLNAAGAADSVFEIYGGAGPLTVYIDNFEITGGENDVDYGGGIEIDNQYTVTLNRVALHDNQSNHGGAVHMSSGTTLAIQNSSLLYLNEALTGNGGGVSCTGGSVTVSNDSYIGFWLFVSLGNTATGNGGGVYLDDCDLILNGNSAAAAAVIENSADNGGGVYATNNAYVAVTGGSAAVNANHISSATGKGGGIYLAGGSDLYVDNGQVNGNTADETGAGIYATDAGTVVDFDRSDSYFCNTARCAQLSNNVNTGLYGGGISLEFGATLDMESVYVEGNQTAYSGSAIYARREGTSVALDSVMVTGNQAGNDQAIRLFDQATAALRSSTVAGNTGHTSATFGVEETTRLNGDGLVVWGNDGSALVAGAGDATLDCSILQTAFPGSNNLVADPRFMDAAGGNYHLAHNSPAIDHCDSGFSRDIDYELRPIDVPGVSALADRPEPISVGQLNAETTHALRIAAADLAARRLDEALDSALRVVNYGPWIWLELNNAQYAQLVASGVPFDEEAGFGVVSFDRWRFDPLRDGEPPLPVDLQDATAGEAGQGLYLVQLRAPAGEQDMDTLRASGVVLQYYPYNAFLLWTDARALRRAERSENVRWTGPFRPGYRITGRLEQAHTAAGSETLPLLQVLLYDDGGLAEVEQTLLAWGGAILTRAPRHVMGEQGGGMTVWEFSLPADRIDDLARLRQTIVVDLQFPSVIDDERSNQIIADNAPGGEPQLGYTAWLNETGYRGRDVTVAIVDSGVDWDHADLNVVSGTEYGGYNEPGEPGSDGGGADAGHGTHVAGIVSGDGSTATADPGGFVYGLGMAPGATVHAMDAIGDGAFVSIYTRVFDAASNADLSNNSWTIGAAGAGYTLNAANLDDYILDAIDTNGNVRDFFLTVFSAGNAGDDCGAGPCLTSLTEPKEAKNLLSVANSLSRRSDTAGSLTGDIDSLRASSSRGPAVDGRILPNVTAPGTNIISTEDSASNVVCTTSPANSTVHAYCSGTSQAAPHVAGSAALFTEFWRLRNGTTANPEPALVKAALINTTDDLIGGDDGWGNVLTARPNVHQGWGRVNIDRALNPTAAIQYYQNPQLFTAAAQTWSKQIAVDDTSQPLRITLVWSDAAGAAGANPARVNDLDLRVAAPNGTTWYGNRFSATGWSTTGAVDDDLHNVENIWILSPLAGTYTVRVEVEFVNGDAWYYNGDPTDQHFSLVCANCEEIVGGLYDAGADEANAFVGLNGAVCAYPTVGSAMAAAANGDTIYVSPGVYPERLGLIDKNLTFVAATGDCTAEMTGGVTIDANDAAATWGGLAEVGTGRTVTFRNLTLADGTAQYGGILYVNGSAHVVLDNTDLTLGSAATTGGGLRLILGATVELINGSQIVDSVTTGTGDGAGAAIYQATLILRGDSRIGDYLHGNSSAGRGGGVFMDGGALQMFDTSRVRSNVATADGGGVYASNGADVELHNSADIGWTTTTSNNDAVNGGGIYLTGSGTTLSLSDDSGVQNNYAGNYGGGIYATAGAGVLVDSSLVNANEAVARAGGMVVDGAATATVQNGSTVNDNLSNDLGGGIYLQGDGGTLTVDASHVGNNTANGWFGGIRVYGNGTLTLRNGATVSGNDALGSSGGGLGIYLGTVNIGDAAIDSNTAAANGGGVYMDSGTLSATDPDIRYNTAASSGGGIYRLAGSLSLTASSKTAYVAVNTATGGSGGGIYDTSGSDLVLRATGDYRLNVNTNQAGANGGGLYADDGTYVDGWGWVQLSSNVAGSNGGALYLTGAATAWLDDTSTHGFEVWVNTATNGNGGGIYASASPQVELDGAEIGFTNNGNQAPAGDGGGIYLDNSTLSADNTLFRFNQAGDDGGAVAAVNGSTVTIFSSMTAPSTSQVEGPVARLPLASSCDPDALAANVYCSMLHNNSAVDHGGALHFEGESSGVIDHTAFLANSAATGSALELYDSDVTLRHSRVSGNTATGVNNSTVHVYNVGGVGPTSTFDALHNTFAGNTHYAVYYAAGTSGAFDNNVVWGNGHPGVITPYATAACNDTQGGALAGAGNVSLDPDFITTPRGDYHLAPASPAMDACAAGGSPDLDNVARPKGVRYDMGAFELWCASGVTDVDGSGSVNIVDIQRVASDWNDLAYLPPHDIDCDGDVDVNDIIAVAADWAP